MIAALIIATGKTASRTSFGPPKMVGSISAVQRIIKVFQRAGIERIVVVSSEDDDTTEKLAAHMNVVFLQGRGDAEMLDNVKKGLVYLQDKCEAALITHVNIPLFSVETVHKLVSADKPIGIPSHKGAVGHPILIYASYFPSILPYTGAGGLAGAIKASGLTRKFVDVEDEGILINIQYRSDYQGLLREHNLTEPHPDARIRLSREKVFYGPGPHQLLELIDETASLKEACRQMGISYNKGRSIVARIGQELGSAAIEGKAGGKDGGYSVVTTEGLDLMQKYRLFCDEVNQSMNDIFKKYF